MKRLCLLDLDHTLIYGSYAPSEAVTLLFKYNEYLSVYERPYVNEFIKRIKEKYTSIIIYTTAKADYAQKINNALHISADQVLSRKDCILKNDRYYKEILNDWTSFYDELHIIDDSPHIWLNTDKYLHKIKFYTPHEFRGEPNDKALISLLDDN